MSLSDVTSLAGTVSAIAVLISLLFLRRQVSQSEKNQRALIQQGRAGRSAEIAMRLMSSDFAEAYHRGMNGDSELSEKQLVQFIGYCRAIFLGAEDSYLQHRDRLLDELAFNSFIRSLRVLFLAPGLRTVWNMTRESYEAEFVAFMDAIASATGSWTHFNPHSQWKSFVSVTMGQQKAA